MLRRLERVPSPLTATPQQPAKQLIGGFILAVCVLGMLSGCDNKKAPPAPAAVPVGLLKLEAKSVELTTELPGRTSAFLVSDVRPQVNGIIKKRNFEEGSDVTEGQSLYEIDPAIYQATYDSAAATLSHDQAALVTAKAKLNRYGPLAKMHAVSQQELDDAQASFAEAEADVKTADAAIEQAKINLAYTNVLAPISGRISHSSFTPGALVTSGQADALATVTQLDPIYVDVIQPTTTLLRLQREMADGKLQSSGPNQANVKLKLEDGTDYPATGKLQFSEVTVDQGTGSVLLRVLFPNPDHVLLPGMYVRAELAEGTDNQALLVPQGAVSRNTHGDAVVMMVGADNMAEPHMIQTDRMIGKDWLVTDGLKAGDKIIVDGLQKIRPGAPVAPSE